VNSAVGKLRSVAAAAAVAAASAAVVAAGSPSPSIAEVISLNQSMLENPRPVVRGR
jgi:hypothetical protein